MYEILPCQGKAAESLMASPWEERHHKYLFLSNYEDAQDEPLLLKHGITQIINLSCCDSLSKLPVLYLPISDDENANIGICLDLAIPFIESGEKTLVHCLAGISRSPTIIIGYLVEKCEMTLQEAYDHVKTKKRFIHPNDGFAQQLRKRYNQELKITRPVYHY